MNKISGKVVVRESGVGIPDLLVVVHDIDSAASTGAPRAAAGVPEKLGARLGAVLTGKTGAFELTYEDQDFRIRAQERRPDLVLSVLAPEEPGKDLAARALYTSNSVRENAARTEQYSIRLPAKLLERMGVPLPTTAADEVEEPNRLIERVVKADTRLQAIDDGVRALDQKRVERVRQTTSAFEARFKPALRTLLSRVPQALVERDNYVAAGESVREKAAAGMRRDIQQIINSDDPKLRPPVKGYLALTAAQKEKLATRLDAGGKISAAALDEVLERAPARTTSFLLHDDPLVQFCRERSQEETHCLAALDGEGHAHTPTPTPPTPPPDGDVPGAGVETVTDADIPRYAARLMETMTSPEERVLTGLEPRASREAVQQDLRDLAFPPSPADTPAFYDFHNLQIAFKHVWQEAIDEGILDLAEDAYTDIVELGGDPRPAGDHPLRGLRDEGRRVLTARRNVRDHRSRTIVRDHRGETVVRDHRGEVIVRDHRDDPVRVTVSGGGVTVTPTHPADRLPQILAELEERLKEDYAFTVYAANRKERSVNFGIVTTYRQKWEPLAYQAGKLVKTITLAPKEAQKYSKKTVVRRKRAEKEVENHLRSRREEASQTARAEQEIVRKALTKTNFSITSEGSFDIAGIGEAKSTTSFSREASKASDDIKKAFHEAVFKAAQEYKDEHNLEVNTEESEEIELVESGEIMNPNDEIAVTFLFYELQRRYRTSERIHKLTPVVLVAQEVPRPDEIDEAWLLSHDWVLRRAILDDSFLPALNYLSQNVVGDAVALEELRRNVEQQRRIVDDLRQELGAVRERADALRALLERALFNKAGVVREHRDEGGGGGFSIPIVGSIPVVGDIVEGAADAVTGLVGGAADALGDFLFGGESGQSRQDALKEAMARATDEARDLLFRLEREVTALNASSEAYSKALAEHLNHKAQIARLRAHVKQNILYYMQAIWSYEPPDQRFFRLHEVAVPVLKAAQQTYSFAGLHPVGNVLAKPAHWGLDLPGRLPVDFYPFDVKTEIDPALEFTTLAQVADLDNLMGFKGNYMIFALKESNALTDYMMAPYIVAGFDELIDPDDLGNWTIEDFARYVCCLKEHLSEEQFAQIKQDLSAQYARLLSAPRRGDDVITVPTQSLFIEALPARHSLMEEFKARHRAVDVKKAQAEVRKAELENLRLTARLLAGEREDPDIEKKIIIEGNPNGIVVPDEG